MSETWPDWIEELKQRYLADEASVFLSRSREIVCTYDPDEGLDFAAVTDRGAFNRLIETRQTLDGKRRRNLGRTPEEVLAQIYMALTTAGPAQGYIIKKTERLVRARRKNLPPLADGAPHIAAWATHRTVRASNNVVVLLAPSVESVRADLALVTAHVHVPAPPPRPDALSPAPGEADPYANLMRRGPPLDLAAAERAAKARMQGAADQASAMLAGGGLGPSEAELRAAAEAEMEAALSGEAAAPAPAAEAPAPPPLPEDAGVPDLASGPTHDGPATAEDIEARLRVALRAAILRHPEGWTDKLPAREAVAATLQDVAPERFGALSFHVVEDESRTVGDGAADFDAWWRGDIAVDAAAGMALSGIEIPEGGLTDESLPALSDAAVRALARRIARLLGS
ncbi:MAG: hypothetical protein H6741_23375 [Alphaproteobacteria bacterium]|nr:hypothetical protein [Alphaproteobacteria bacterium]MCB9795650.1 hypothetical protein [Alphaproteobacteria bacterium]